MEPATTQETPPNQEAPQTPELKKDNHGITVLSMAIFVLLSLAAVVFLYYQNQQLKNMLSNYQTPNFASPTPESKPISSPTTNLPPNTFDFCGSSNPNTLFYIAPPKGWTVELGDYSEAYQQYKITKDDEWINITCGDGFGGGGCPPEADKSLLIAKENVRSCIVANTDKGNVSLNLSYLKAPNGNTFSFTGLVDNQQTLNQILSTFKFLGETPIPSSKACTLEAKICPDGSSVGRTGPNCEFAPCPTP